MRLFLVPLTREILVAPPARTPRIPGSTSTGTLPCFAPGSASREIQEATAYGRRVAFIYRNCPLLHNTRLDLCAGGYGEQNKSLGTAAWNMALVSHQLESSGWGHPRDSEPPALSLSAGLQGPPQEGTSYHPRARFGTLNAEKQNVLGKLCSHFP